MTIPDTEHAIAWSDAWLVGFGPLDRVHQAFVQALATVLDARDDDLEIGLTTLLEHARRQFDLEDLWMDESRFPPRDCHTQEHAAVMASFAEVMARVHAGDRAEGRRFAAAVADWFPKHVMHLDSALGHWMFKQNASGKPIVFRRHAARSN